MSVRSARGAEAGASVSVSRRGSSEGFLIQHRAESCRQCWSCVRHCPAKAIGVTPAGAVVVREKCVECGACVASCGNSGHVVRDDTPSVVDLLASDRPVVAVLATEATAAMHPRSVLQVEAEAEQIGFYAVESTLVGEEIVAAEYERLLAQESYALRLRSTCPVTVEWVRRFHPKLVSALAPVVPPYVAQAMLVKALYPHDTAVVYVSPCYARKDEFRDPQFGDAIDAAVDFEEFATLLDRMPPAPHRPRAGLRRPAPVKEVSLTDGFPRRAISGRDMTDAEVISVRGLRELDKLLNAITRGEVAPSIVDMMCCDGCLDGPAVAPGMSVFAKRNMLVAEREQRAMSGMGCRRLLPYLPRLDLRRSFSAEPVTRPAPPDAEIDQVLAEGEFRSRDDAIDCGACGYDTCVEQAVAILGGTSTWEMCWPLQARRLERSLEELELAATTDPLTGLANRRSFEARLAAEVERVNRYGSPLSVMMLDLDGFKRLNDTCGHRGGDRVLVEVADLIRSSLRATDVPVRYGGDEFAVMLPGIGKTEAFAVAEKIREAVASVRCGCSSEPERHVTASIGVATCASPPCAPEALLEAADRALYHAKGKGRDRVGLAPD